MNNLNNDYYILKLKQNNNKEEKKDKADERITIKLYNNCFIVKTENNFEKHFSFKSNKNLKLFERIKQGIFPLKLIKDSKIKLKDDCNLCIIIEDYIKQNYFYLDPNYETTEIIIKLVNGQSIKKILNPFHTINDIKELIENESSIPINEFTFLFDYPPKQILEKDYNKTIIELGLINSTLIQKKIDK